MSSPFHVFKGAGLAVATSASVGVVLGSDAFYVWMLVLILATNMADKDMLWKMPLRWWIRRRLRKEDFERRVRAWCWIWGRHRKITHSPVGVVGDLKVLMSLVTLFQSLNWLPQFDPTWPLLWALISHLVVDMVDGSEGISIFAPFSRFMLKLPALFQDLDLSHMMSEDPLIRRAFWYKAKWETALVLVFNSMAYAGVVRL